LPLVGRQAELASVTGALVPGPQPGVLVLAGEAGVGKSRLVAGAVDRARAAGVTVPTGNCLPLSDSVPFLPLTEALRALGSDGGTVVRQRCAPSVRAELARLIPGWAAGPVDQGPVAAAVGDRAPRCENDHPGGPPMPVRFQPVVDCADPDRLARFWAAALGYELTPPPAGFATWDDYYRDLGLPEEELDGVLYREGLDHYAVAMKDPEGNEFDVN
jgi:hypothetical protein